MPSRAVGDGDAQVERRGQAAVADAELDVIDVVAVGIARQVEIGRGVEGQRAGAAERELAGVGAARDRIGQRVALGIGRGRLIAERGVLDDAWRLPQR